MKYILLAIRFSVAAAQRILHILTLGAFPPPFACGLAVIRRGDSVLMIERADGLGLGLPGGHARLDETIEDAARRETKEETGLDLRLEGLVTVLSGARKGLGIRAVDVVFLARIEGLREPRGSREGPCRWMRLDELEGRRVVAGHLDAIRRALAGSRDQCGAGGG